MSIKTNPLEPNKSGQTLFLGSGVKYKSVIFSIAAVIIAVASSFYGKYMEAANLDKQMPKANLEGVVGAIRNFQRVKHSLPNEWDDLYVAGVWKAPPKTDKRYQNGYLISAYGNQNYIYLYSRLRPDLASVWIIPQGPRKLEAKTFFVTLGPQSIRYWVGPPEILDPNPIPEISVLNALGFIEGSVPDPKKKN